MNSKLLTNALIAIVVIAIIAVINVIIGGSGMGNFLRLDLTQDKLYTLNQGTKNILGKIEDGVPVTLRYYASTDDRVMPPVLRNYARSIEDLLNEFRKAAKGRLIIEKLAANPNTDEEDKATADEMQGVPANNDGDKFYLGIAIECLQQKEVLPFLNPSDETKLEYNIARAIQKVSLNKKPVIGIMSPLPMMGSGNAMPFQMQQQQQQPAWVIVQQLRMDYDVREVPMTTTKIDSDITVLVVVHPANIEDSAQYAIDQFVLRGGKAMIFVDPKSVVGEHFSQQAMQQQRMGGAPSMINPQSNLKKLFTTWGIGFDENMIVADMTYRANMGQRENPTALMLSKNALNKDDRLTSDLNSLFMLTPGSFSITKTDGVETTILAKSSELSSPISSADAEKAGREALNNFSPGGRNLPLVVRLTGKFKTAFPDGAPAHAAKPKEGGGPENETKPAPATPPAAAPTPAPAAPPVVNVPATPSAPAAPAPAAPAKPADPDQLKESKNGDAVVLLIADADMMYDGLCLQRDPFGGVQESNGNLSMFLGAIEMLSGGGDLIAVRNRASTTRPFKTLQEKKTQVEEKYRPEMSKLQTELQEATEKMANLKGKVDKKTQRIILTPESQADMQRWQEKQGEVQKKINDIKKSQRKALEWEEMKIKLFNISFVPLIVIIIGLILAINRRVATAAR